VLERRLGCDPVVVSASDYRALRLLWFGSHVSGAVGNRSPKGPPFGRSLLLIYPHNQVEIRGNSSFQILGKKFLDQRSG
jgi:hypothetical protein